MPIPKGSCHWLKIKMIKRYQFNTFNFHMKFNVFRILRRLLRHLSGHSGPQLSMQRVNDMLTPIHMRMDYILTFSNTLSIVDPVKHIPNRPPNTCHPSQLWVTLTSKQIKIPSQFPLTTVSTCDLPGQTVSEHEQGCGLSVWWRLKPSYCAAALDQPGCSLSHQKSFLWHCAGAYCLWTYSLLHASGYLWSF